MSELLKLKSRIPFVRQPSSESLIERGNSPVSVPLEPMPSRPLSVATTVDGLRPLSLRSDTPLTAAEDAFEEPRRSGIRARAEAVALEGARLAGIGYRAAAPVAKAAAVPVALVGLTAWCIALTVQVARNRDGLAALNDMPFCDELGLVPAAQFHQY